MTEHSQVEIERKYDVEAGATMPDLRGIGAIATTGVPETFELVAVYHDTEALDLAAGRIALRHREGGHDAGWHIKEPAAEGRTERHWPSEPGETEVPGPVLAAVAGITAGRPLVPIARVRNRRIVTALLDAAGYQVAEFCDDHVEAIDLIAGTRREWREWEIELSEAAPDNRTARTRLLDQLEAAVLEGGARVSTTSSKLARALGREDAGD
jgi:inorganic triphosphatase YgiF